MALYGLPALPLGVAGDGATDVTGEGHAGRRARHDGEFHRRRLRRPNSRGRIAAWNDALTAKGKVRLDAADIEPWLMTTGIGLPGMGFGLPVALAADADYSNGVLSLAGLNGTMEEGAVSGDLKAELKDGLPHLRAH